MVLHCNQHSKYKDSCQNCITKNREYQRSYKGKWIQTHRDEYNKYRRNYYKRKPELFKKIVKEGNIRLKVKVLKLLGSKCVSCGNDDIRILTLNHIHGNGLKHRRLIAKKRGFIDNTQTFYRDILYGRIKKSLFDIRCYNCNILYEYQRGRLVYPSSFTTRLRGFKL